MLYQSLISVVLVSLASLIGIFTITLRKTVMDKLMFVFVSFAAGALLGNAFFHIIPEVSKEFNDTYLYIVLGILLFFSFEKFFRWRHCHVNEKNHVHPMGHLSLLGDAVHNFFDGMAIGIGYQISIPVGIGTTLSVLLHEIPQEMGDFGILISSGFSKTKALIYNFITALTSILGVLVVFFIPQIVALEFPIMSLIAGGFIYIAGVDLLPQLHHETDVKKSVIQFIAISLGIIIMLML